MKRTFLAVIGVALLTGALALGSGPAASAQAPLSNISGSSDLVDVATNSDVNASVRSAAADVVSIHWSQLESPGGGDPVSADTLFSLNGEEPSPTSEGRLLGFNAQLSRILSDQDPLIGEPLTGVTQQDGETVPIDNSQLYADMALAENASSVTVERRYVRAAAVVFNIRQGFAIVPGGPAEAFNRIQSCIVDGSIETNAENNTVNGVSLDCSSEAVRRAVSDFIAGGFYTNFGDLPAVDFGCEARLSQAESGSTVAARWAAAQSYVQSCVDNTIEDLRDIAGNGNSTELQVAAVSPLVEALAETDTTARGHLEQVTQFAGQPRVALAHGWAAGLNFAQQTVTPDTTAQDILTLQSLADGAANAPFAKFFNNQAELDLGRLTLTKNVDVDGAELPLRLSVQVLQ